MIKITTIRILVILPLLILSLCFCGGKTDTPKAPQTEKTGTNEGKTETTAVKTSAVPAYYTNLQKELKSAAGLDADIISFEHIINGTGAANFKEKTGAAYKPSRNEDPAIPVQCWIETGYGTQNACKYCHTNYLAQNKHGNNFAIGEDQVLFSFPTPNLNKINWRNVTHPQEILERLKAENIPVPQPDDPANLDYVRTDNWTAAYNAARPDGDTTWDNAKQKGKPFQLFPALNPKDLYPFNAENPTGNNTHGYIDAEGFVKDKTGAFTGWRAVNFFPYAIFTPLTGSVSGIYIRLPKPFMTKDGKIDMETYKKNLDLLERNIKMDIEAGDATAANYLGDAAKIAVQKGFYPVGTEFAHPLHYVDLNADAQSGKTLDGVKNNAADDYEFPGTRSKRVKEIRYMYKWKEVTLDDIDDPEIEDTFDRLAGKEWQGWIDNKAGWIISAYTENRKGELRPQTTEELLQCLGCHSSVGNTIDAVWSFQRKLPGNLGWQEMNYGHYSSADKTITKLNDYQNENIDGFERGELEYFYYSVVGADLFGVMPNEIKTELKTYVNKNNLTKELELKTPIDLIFDDDKLKSTPKEQRETILKERAAIMRHYAKSHAYLYKDPKTNEYYIKGSIFYPTPETMKANIAGYLRIVLDQSYNLGKGTFGSQPESIPFTFRSDGTTLDANNKIIPTGNIITSRPYGKDGVGTTPTKLAKTNKNGEPIDNKGNPINIETSPQNSPNHTKNKGTFDTMYNPIIKKKLKKK